MQKKLAKKQSELPKKTPVNFKRKSEFFSGPLPHPAIFEQYEKVLEGSANRILTMAEKQSSHRQNIEQKIIKSSTRNETIGMIFSFIITAALMYFGYRLVLVDKNVIGYFSIFSPAIFHASVFIYNKIKDSKEDNKK
jgi:uncharacterized membrane protein